MDGGNKKTPPGGGVSKASCAVLRDYSTNLIFSILAFLAAARTFAMTS